MIKKKIFLLVLITMIPALVHATKQCGNGKITLIAEGVDGSDDLHLVIDYSVAEEEGSSTTNHLGMIVFKEATLPNRIDHIRTMALTAFVTGTVVGIESTNDSCDDATLLGLLKDIYYQ